MGAQFVSIILFLLLFGSIIGIKSPFCMCDLPVLVQLLGAGQVVRGMTEVA